MTKGTRIAIGALAATAAAAALVVTAACGSLADVGGKDDAAKRDDASPAAPARRLALTWDHAEPARAFTVSRVAKGTDEARPLARLAVGDAALAREGNTWTHVLSGEASRGLAPGDCLEVAAEAEADGARSPASERACVEAPAGATSGADD